MNVSFSFTVAICNIVNMKSFSLLLFLAIGILAVYGETVENNPIDNFDSDPEALDEDELEDFENDAFEENGLFHLRKFVLLVVTLSFSSDELEDFENDAFEENGLFHLRKFVLLVVTLSFSSKTWSIPIETWSKVN